MTKARLTAILLTMALALGSASAVLADSHEEGEFDMEVGTAAYLAYRNALLAAGAAEGDLLEWQLQLHHDAMEAAGEALASGEWDVDAGKAAYLAFRNALIAAGVLESDLAESQLMLHSQAKDEMMEEMAE
jgi:hypothetical protein